MGRQLAAYVHVTDDRGASHGFGPGDDVPAWAAAKITNPDAWSADDPEPAEEPDSPEPDLDGVVPPPMGGAGSGVAEWLAYAGSLGVEVPEESRSKRDDVIAVLREAGKPVERSTD